MKEVIKRLQSPIVIAQIISIVVGVLIFFIPQSTDAIKVVSSAIVGIINLLAGLNNPTDKENF